MNLTKERIRELAEYATVCDRQMETCELDHVELAELCRLALANLETQENLRREKAHPYDVPTLDQILKWLEREPR